MQMCLQVYRFEWAYSMRVAAVTTVTSAILADIFVQCVESVQHTVHRWTATAAVGTRRVELCRSPRQHGGHWHHETLVGVAFPLHPRSTFRQKQGMYAAFSLFRLHSGSNDWQLLSLWHTGATDIISHHHQWRRLHRALGGTCPQLLQMARHRGTVSRRTANNKLTKLYWPMTITKVRASPPPLSDSLHATGHRLQHWKTCFSSDNTFTLARNSPEPASAVCIIYNFTVTDSVNSIISCVTTFCFVWFHFHCLNAVLARSLLRFAYFLARVFFHACVCDAFRTRAYKFYHVMQRRCCHITVSYNYQIICVGRCRNHTTLPQRLGVVFTGSEVALDFPFEYRPDTCRSRGSVTLNIVGGCIFFVFGDTIPFTVFVSSSIPYRALDW